MTAMAGEGGPTHECVEPGGRLRKPVCQKRTLQGLALGKLPLSGANCGASKSILSGRIYGLLKGNAQVCLHRMRVAEVMNV